MSEPWYVKREGRVIGPFGDPEIRTLIERGKVGAGTHVRRGTAGDWIPAADAGLPVAEPSPASPADAGRPSPPDEEAAWYFAHAGVQSGPHPLATLRELAAAGTLAPGDLVWTPGMDDWQPCGLVPAIGAGPPPPGPVDEPVMEIEPLVEVEAFAGGGGRPAWLLPGLATVLGIVACSLGGWALSRSTEKPAAESVPAPPPASAPAVAAIAPAPAAAPPAPPSPLAPAAPATATAASAEALMRQVMMAIRGRRLDEARVQLARYREAPPPRDDRLADRLERDIETAGSRDEADRLAASLDDASLRACLVDGGRALAERLETVELRMAYRTTLLQALGREMNRRRSATAAAFPPRINGQRQRGMAPTLRGGFPQPPAVEVPAAARIRASLDDVLAKPADFRGKPLILDGLFKISTRVGPVKDRDRVIGLSLPLARNDERTVCTGDRPIAGSDLYLLLDPAVAGLLERSAVALDMKPNSHPSYRAILGVAVRPLADLAAREPADGEAAAAQGPLALVVETLEILGLCDYLKVANRQFDGAFRVLTIDGKAPVLRYGDGSLWVEHFGGEEKFVKPVRQKLQQVRRRLAANSRQAVAEAAFNQAFATAMKSADAYNGIRRMQDSTWQRVLSGGR